MITASNNTYVRLLCTDYLRTFDMVVKVVAESMYHVDCVVTNFELEMTRKQH